MGSSIAEQGQPNVPASASADEKAAILKMFERDAPAVAAMAGAAAAFDDDDDGAPVAKAVDLRRFL